MIKKVGLLGGSFDPIHWGHFNLAFELMEKKGLDEVWFIPAQLNPLKVHMLPTSFDHRLNMVKLAIQGIPCFKVKDLEIQRPPPSYTIDTLKSLIEQEKVSACPCQFFLLLGEDNLNRFLEWRFAEEIAQLVPLLVGSRTGTNVDLSFIQSPVIREAMQKGLTQTRLMDISSTELRQRLSLHRYCAHLIPSSVLTYIDYHQLYR